MYVCMYVRIRKFTTRELLQPKQSRVRAREAILKRCVFSLLQNYVSVSVGSQSDNGKEFHTCFSIMHSQV